MISVKSPYCLICGRQIYWADKITLISYNYKKVEYPFTEVKRLASDTMHFHRRCFNNSAFAKLLGKDGVADGSKSRQKI